MKKRQWLVGAATAACLVGLTAPAALAAGAPTTASTLLAPAATPTVVTAAAVKGPEAAERTIFAKTNQLRAANGRAKLVRDAKMDAVAAAWASKMATTGRFQHNPSFSKQIPAGWRAAGENIAMNTYDPVRFYVQWRDSPGHRANMLNAKYNRIGIGVVQKNGKYYGVQVFGQY